jgi:hypothetical protein
LKCPKNAKAATLEVAACGNFDVLYLLIANISTPTRYAATSKKVAVDKSVAKSIGVHLARNISLAYSQSQELVYSNDL